MAKWRRGGGGRRGSRWVIEYVPVSCEGRGARGEEEQAQPETITPEVKKTPDPFEYDAPAQIRNALAAMENEAPAENVETVN